MKAVIVHYNAEDRNEILNGIYTFESGNALRDAVADIQNEHNLLSVIPFEVNGRTYAERKDDLREKAIDWSYAGSVASWSYGELAEILEFFEKNGKRYGLLAEFRENAII